jgi:hypothetical protein
MAHRKPDKNQRRVSAMQDEMARVLKRLRSLSVTMMRADAAWEAYHREMTKVIASKQSDDEILAALNRQSWRVENNDFLRASAHMTIWLALLYVVIEGWRKWNFFDQSLDSLLASPYVAELKQYRHAIFHATEFDQRAVLEFEGSSERTQWTGEMANALRQAIRDWNAKTEERLEEYLSRSPL